MTESEEKPKHFAAKLKESVEHGKAISMAVVLVLSTGMGIYHFFAPEQEARVSYTTLKPVVEDTANEVQRLQIRLDYAEKMMMMRCAQTSVAVADVRPTKTNFKIVNGTAVSEPEPVSVLESASLEPPAPRQHLQLPDEPWAHKQK